ncbi:MAG TPA: hypothetical protein VF234_08105, partial [Limnochordia bacterium]
QSPVIRVDLRFVLPPSPQARIAVLTRVGGLVGSPSAASVESAWSLAPQSAAWRELITLAPGNAVAVTLKEKAAADRPQVRIEIEPSRLAPGASAAVTVSVLNTLGEPISGKIRLAGIPPTWEIEYLSPQDAFHDLTPGGVFTNRFRVRAAAPVTAADAFGLLVLENPVPAAPIEIPSLPVRLEVSRSGADLSG